MRRACHSVPSLTSVARVVLQLQLHGLRNVHLRPEALLDDRLDDLREDLSGPRRVLVHTLPLPLDVGDVEGTNEVDLALGDDAEVDVDPDPRSLKTPPAMASRTNFIAGSLSMSILYPSSKTAIAARDPEPMVT